MQSELIELSAKIRNGDRRALARGITLVESTHPDHREKADQLIQSLLPYTGNAIRIGISGVPGVGKSTFIEAFGLHVTGKNRKVAVLAVDPTSPKSGGSILGDKTRMEELSKSSDAFIRPSPSGGTLGGVARRTREVLLLCEAAKFDVVLVETVGVGQSETAVADLVDMFILLLTPGGGDELQGIKKGIVELADLIVVNKADGDLAPAADRAMRDYSAALHLLRPDSESWTPKVLKASALKETGISEVWETTCTFRETQSEAGIMQRRREQQANSWMWNEINETLLSRLHASKDVSSLILDLGEAVKRGETTPSSAARQILSGFSAGTPKNFQ